MRSNCFYVFVVLFLAIGCSNSHTDGGNEDRLQAKIAQLSEDNFQLRQLVPKDKKPAPVRRNLEEYDILRTEEPTDVELTEIAPMEDNLRSETLPLEQRGCKDQCPILDRVDHVGVYYVFFFKTCIKHNTDVLSVVRKRGFKPGTREDLRLFSGEEKNRRASVFALGTVEDVDHFPILDPDNKVSMTLGEGPTWCGAGYLAVR